MIQAVSPHTRSSITRFLFTRLRYSAMATPSEHFDVIIVGAGVHGLCAAHTFLSIDPSLSLLILDDKSTIGGVWAEEQLYPGLRANNLQGYYEFTDFPILEAGLQHMGVYERSILSGEALFAYLQKYAERFGLLQLTRLNCKVIRAMNNAADSANAWALEVVNVGNSSDNKVSGESNIINCRKLVVATGQASQPLLPSISNMENFGKPIIHSADLGKLGNSLISSPSVSHVTVLGGSKSAHDAVYMFATAGKRVTWIMRPKGRGAMPMAKPDTQIGPWKVWLEGLLMTRPLSWFAACPWSDGDGFRWSRWALHQTSFGRWLVKSYFANMSSESAHQSGILRDKTKMLVPEHSLLWYGTQASSLNYDIDFYDIVGDDRIDIFRENIVTLDRNRVLLENQTVITDVLVCATGYDYTPTLSLEPKDNRLGWGVPVSVKSDRLFPPLDEKADIELFERFPILSASPTSLERQPGFTPWRLWRFIAPPSQVCSRDRSLAFLCAIVSYQTTIKAELTSLWAYAFLFDQLSETPEVETDVLYEAALWSRYGKWSRPLGMQGKIADFLLDSMPYYDTMLRDLGLTSWRKGFGLVGEVFGRWYSVKDYRGVVDEWISKRRRTES